MYIYIYIHICIYIYSVSALFTGARDAARSAMSDGFSSASRRAASESLNVAPEPGPWRRGCLGFRGTVKGFGLHHHSL